MNPRRIKKAGQCLALAVTILLTLAACQQEMPMSPQTEALSGGDVAAEMEIETTIGPRNVLKVAPAHQAAALARTGDRAFWTEEFVEAGELTELVVGNARLGHSKLRFRENSLAASDTIYFEWAASETFDGMLSGLEFGPHGTQFQRPVILFLSYKAADLNGINEDDLQFFYYNDVIGVWELMPCEVDKVHKRVRVRLQHFSRYALSHG